MSSPLPHHPSETCRRRCVFSYEISPPACLFVSLSASVCVSLCLSLPLSLRALSAHRSFMSSLHTQEFVVAFLLRVIAFATYIRMHTFVTDLEEFVGVLL